MSKEKKQISERPEESCRAVLVSLIYAKEDETMASDIKYALLPMEKLGKIKLQDFSKLTLSDNAEEEDLAVLKSSSLVLVLISPDFLAKDFCYSEDARLLIESAQSKQLLLIPIILRPSPLWKEVNFGKFEELPKDGDAMTEYQNNDRALHDVVKGIKKQIYKIIERTPHEVSI